MRARNLKPGFFKNEDLAELPHWQRLLFAGLWLLSDRAGRFEVRPRRIKRELFPGEDLDILQGITALAQAGFVGLYEIAGVAYGQILQWRKHQNPHKQEAPSNIPAMRSEVASKETGSRRADSLIPDSLIPDSQKKKQSKIKSKGTAAQKAAPLELPEWLSVDDWTAWHDYRKRRGKGWTEHAQRLSVRTLDKLRMEGHDPRAVIEQSIERGYTGLFRIGSEGGGNGKRGQGVADRVIANARRGYT